LPGRLADMKDSCRKQQSVRCGDEPSACIGV
jgi:hypothetical protein